MHFQGDLFKFSKTIALIVTLLFTVNTMVSAAPINSSSLRAVPAGQLKVVPKDLRADLEEPSTEKTSSSGQKKSLTLFQRLTGRDPQVEAAIIDKAGSNVTITKKNINDAKGYLGSVGDFNVYVWQEQDGKKRRIVEILPPKKSKRVSSKTSSSGSVVDAITAPVKRLLNDIKESRELEALIRLKTPYSSQLRVSKANIAMARKVIEMYGDFNVDIVLIFNKKSGDVSYTPVILAPEEAWSSLTDKLDGDIAVTHIFLDHYGLADNCMRVDRKEGTLSLDLTDTQTADFSPLSAIGEGASNKKVIDLGLIVGLPFTALNLTNRRVALPSSFREMPLTELNLTNTNITSLAPFYGLPIVRLYLTNTKITVDQLGEFSSQHFNPEMLTIVDMAGEEITYQQILASHTADKPESAKTSSSGNVLVAENGEIIRHSANLLYKVGFVKVSGHKALFSTIADGNSYTNIYRQTEDALDGVEFKDVDRVLIRKAIRDTLNGKKVSVSDRFQIEVDVDVKVDESGKQAITPIIRSVIPIQPLVKTSSSGTKTLLVIEDDSAVQGLLKIFFKREGFNVIFADNGIEGIEKLRELSEEGLLPDLIVTDNTMPRMTGLQFLENLRTDSALSDFNRIPVIAFTSDSITGVKEGFISLGIKAFVEKSHHTALVNTVKEILDDTKPVASVSHEKTILIVDDRKIVRKTVGEFLAAEGRVIDFAENGLDAIDKLRALQSEGRLPDLILSDINMPKMNGIEFVGKLRRDSDLNAFKDIPVIVLSMNDNRAYREAFDEFAISAYILKGDGNGLSVAVDQVLGDGESKTSSSGNIFTRLLNSLSKKEGASADDAILEEYRKRAEEAKQRKQGMYVDIKRHKGVNGTVTFAPSNNDAPSDAPSNPTTFSIETGRNIKTSSAGWDSVYEQASAMNAQLRDDLTEYARGLPEYAQRIKDNTEALQAIKNDKDKDMAAERQKASVMGAILSRLLTGFNKQAFFAQLSEASGVPTDILSDDISFGILAGNGHTAPFQITSLLDVILLKTNRLKVKKDLLVALSKHMEERGMVKGDTGGAIVIRDAQIPYKGHILSNLLNKDEQHLAAIEKAIGYKIRLRSQHNPGEDGSNSEMLLFLPGPVDMPTLYRIFYNSINPELSNEVVDKSDGEAMSKKNSKIADMFMRPTAEQLESDDQEAKTSSAGFITSWRIENSMEKLINGSSTEKKLRAIDYLKNITDDDSVIAVIIKALCLRDTDVRRAAAQALLDKDHPRMESLKPYLEIVVEGEYSFSLKPELATQAVRAFLQGREYEIEFATVIEHNPKAEDHSLPYGIRQFVFSDKAVKTSSSGFKVNGFTYFDIDFKIWELEDKIPGLEYQLKRIIGLLRNEKLLPPQINSRIDADRMNIFTPSLVYIGDMSGGRHVFMVLAIAEKEFIPIVLIADIGNVTLAGRATLSPSQIREIIARRVPQNSKAELFWQEALQISSNEKTSDDLDTVLTIKIIPKEYSEEGYNFTITIPGVSNRISFQAKTAKDLANLLPNNLTSKMGFKLSIRVVSEWELLIDREFPSGKNEQVRVGFYDITGMKENLRKILRKEKVVGNGKTSSAGINLADMDNYDAEALLAKHLLEYSPKGDIAVDINQQAVIVYSDVLKNSPALQDAIRASGDDSRRYYLVNKEGVPAEEFLDGMGLARSLFERYIFDADEKTPANIVDSIAAVLQRNNIEQVRVFAFAEEDLKAWSAQSIVEVLIMLLKDKRFEIISDYSREHEQYIRAQDDILSAA